MITRAASMSVSVAVAAVTAAVAGANAAATTTWAELPPPRRTQQPGVISWEYSHHPSACPCANASLCLPIRRVGPEKAFVFHTGYKSDRPVWSLYDWTQITTICIFGSLTPELYCHAHSLGVRVTMGLGFPPATQWSNTTAVDTFVKSAANSLAASGLDGWNLDIEVTDTASQGESMVDLAETFTKAIHSAVPGSQVSFDTDSLSAPCSSYPSPSYHYDVARLSDVVDFLVVMDYDSAPETNQVPFYKGPMAMNLLKQGVEKYQQKGVSPARLVLAFPWYSYAWIVNKTCSGNGTCPGALARTDIGVGQTPSAPTFTCPGGSFAPITGFYFPPSLTGTGHCPSAMGLVPYSTCGEEWDEWGSTPFIRYSDPRVPCVTECGYHYEVWYENNRSLAAKHAYAREVGAHGVGMWTANNLNYDNQSQYRAIWESLKSFTQTM